MAEEVNEIQSLDLDNAPDYWGAKAKVLGMSRSEYRDLSFSAGWRGMSDPLKGNENNKGQYFK